MRSPDPIRVIELAKALATKRNELAVLQAKWDALFAGGAKVQPELAFEGEPKRVTSSLVSGILDLMNSDRSAEYTVEDIVTRFEANENSAASTLSRMVRKGKIEKRGPRSYGAVSHVERESSELAVTE